MLVDPDLPWVHATAGVNLVNHVGGGGSRRREMNFDLVVLEPRQDRRPGTGVDQARIGTVLGVREQDVTAKTGARLVRVDRADGVAGRVGAVDVAERAALGPVRRPAADEVQRRLALRLVHDDRCTA